jgi:hypothetical protein
VSPGTGWTPQYLSERAAIVAAGIATPFWRGLMGWFEAGVQMPVLSSDTAINRKVTPDSRGGASFTKGIGHLLTSGSRGLFAETNDDVIYVRRFEGNTIIYSQNRAGFTLPQPETALGGIHVQLYWNANVTTDAKRLYWANTAEMGPGIRFRFPRWPLLFSIDALRGGYLVNTGNPREPTFTDLRAGVWYAFTR